MNLKRSLLPLPLALLLAAPAPAHLSVRSTLRQIHRRFPRWQASEVFIPDAFQLYYDDVKAGIAFTVGGNGDILATSSPDAIIVHGRGARVVPTRNSRPTRLR